MKIQPIEWEKIFANDNEKNINRQKYINSSYNSKSKNNPVKMGRRSE